MVLMSDSRCSELVRIFSKFSSCFGGSASRYPSARKWVEEAVPFILQINSRENGKPQTVPG